MKNIKRILLALVLVITCGIYSAQAQVYVKVRPERPHYERVARPGARHVWIDEDWEPRNGSYVFVGGHWAEPPGRRGTWAPGRWKHHRDGWVWVAGRWR